MSDIEKLFDTLDTCHICQGKLHLEDWSPTHCEDCSWDCDEHDDPACDPMWSLLQKARTELAALRAELIAALEELTGAPSEPWQLEDPRARHIDVQVSKKEYVAARKRLEELKK